jgi:hypothetical protein
MDEIETPKDQKVEVIVLGKIKSECFNDFGLIESALIAQRKEEYRSYTLFHDQSTGVLALLKCVEE